MADSDILRQMINESDDQVINIESSISQIQTQIDDLDDQISAVQDGMCAVAETNMTNYLNNTKLAELEALYGNQTNLPFSVSYGGTYGTIDYETGNIDDWQVLDSTAVVQYEYLVVNWDSDSTAVSLITSYDFGNDYLTRPLTSGASYGLIPYRSNLNTAKSLLTNNKNKVAASKTTMEDYAS